MTSNIPAITEVYDDLQRVLAKLQAIGAYFAYIRHPYADIGSDLVAEKLAKIAGIVCLPGDYFGEGQEGYLRFAFANADAATILKLEERLNGFSLPGI